MTSPADTTLRQTLAKVPGVTLGFWVIKILATTLGETGADLATQQYAMGYLAGIALFAAPLAVLVAVQICARRFHPALYWATILASTTAGTAMADFVDRSLGIGYAGGAALLLGGVLAALAAWKWALGTVAVASVSEPRAEMFYWLTITLAQTLGTALGDWAADDGGLGYVGGAAVFGGALALVALAWWRTRARVCGDLAQAGARMADLSDPERSVLKDVSTGSAKSGRSQPGISQIPTHPSRVALFWAAFILTRPLGATLGDALDKPLAQGGLNLGRDHATLVLLAAIALALCLIPQHPGKAH